MEDTMPQAIHHPVPRLSPQSRAAGLPVARSLVWLQRGWDDFRRMPLYSLAHGCLAMSLGMFLLLGSWKMGHLAPALIGGFMLFAPFLALPFFKASMEMERQNGALRLTTFDAWRQNTGSIALYGLVLSLALLAWLRISAISVAIFHSGQVPETAHVISDLLSGAHDGLAVAFFGSGALMALLVFSFSVISGPLLLDRRIDVISAMLTSLRICHENPALLLAWAGLVALLTLVGFATLLIGLVVIFPILGHATWHAYRDLAD
jgi:uncharacterized membrane protein